METATTAARPLAGWHEPLRARGLPGDDLEAVLTRLQEAEINAWVSTTPPAHIAAGIHDPYGGLDIREDFHTVAGEWPRDAISTWLIAAANRLYPGRLD
jgi:hypothetical protein